MGQKVLQHRVRRLDLGPVADLVVEHHDVRIRDDCALWVTQLGSSLRPGLTKAHAADVMVTVQSPYVYSMLTVDLGWSPAQYERWLAHALPRLLVRPELLSD